MVLIRKMTLLKRLVLWLLAISLVSLMVIGYIGSQIRDTIRRHGLERVHSILERKFGTIEEYIDQRYVALDDFSQMVYFISSHHPLFTKSFWQSSPDVLQSEFSRFASKSGFYDLFIVTTEGEILYTVKKEDDFQTNLVSGKYRDSELARVVARALKNEKPYISDFYYYEPSRDYAAFIAQPVYNGGKMVGIVAAQIDNKTIQSVILDYAELGASGEVIATVRRYGRIVTMAPLRNAPIDAFEPLELGRMAPLVASAGGGRGEAYMDDPLGRQAAVAWGYLDKLRWGFVISIEEDELLHDWYRQIASLMLLFVIGVVVVIAMIVIAFRSFAEPIEELIRYARMVSRGEYDLPIESGGYDREWQLLIDVFHRMAADIKDKMAQLSEQNRMLGAHKDEIEKLNQKLEEKIRIKTEQLKEYVNVIDRYIITSQTDANGLITYASDAFCRISGYTKEELIGQSHRIIRHPDMAPEFFDDLWKTISSGNIWHGEIKNRKSDGGYYWVDTTISPDVREGKIIGYTAVRYDITDKKRIEELVITDSMTGLFNRRHYVKVIEEEMNRAKRHGTTLALMMIDVDYFKRYNDTYGHQAGDRVLNSVADVLKSYTARSGEYAFRLGGEEFGVVVTDMSAEEYRNLAALICRKVEELELLHEKNDASGYVTVSVGLSIYEPESEMSCEELYKEADTRLYHAKEQGRNRVAVG